ncbi:hypothetical protein BV22DRAFT_1051970 [Leucogyrophana mollusca]|uniref:Uncharacterized protein n=1 Tax=Leucogyrophana mollusca TaxID=85980 RepID=A0ACB8AYM4_9AGAM|nr:hypothetical protein BV22DRAFT_1051970 [Leucogyrophana mollusca]
MCCALVRGQFQISDKSEWSRRLRKNTEIRGVLRKDSRENNWREKDLEVSKPINSESFRHSGVMVRPTPELGVALLLRTVRSGYSNRKPVQQNNKKDKGGMVPEGGVGPEFRGAMWIGQA